MSSDIEARLRSKRDVFEKCIKDPSLVSHLASKSVISEGEQTQRVTTVKFRFKDHLILRPSLLLRSLQY